MSFEIWDIIFDTILSEKILIGEILYIGMNRIDDGFHTIWDTCEQILYVKPCVRRAWDDQYPS